MSHPHPFVEVAEALREIRDKGLWRGTHQNWADYCQERWSLDSSEVDHILSFLESSPNN